MIRLESHHEMTDYILRLSGSEVAGEGRLHRCYELIFVDSGSVTLEISSNDERMSAGDAALVFPGQLHTVRPDGEASFSCAVISPDYLERFDRLHAGTLPDSAVILSLPSAVRDAVLGEDAGEIVFLAGLYGALSAFDASRTYRAYPAAKLEFPFRVLEFIGEHYTEDLTLDELSDHLGYDYNYLSGYVSDTFRVGFLRIVNEHRVLRACEHLVNSDLSVSEIALAAGFDCLRSFNRNFKAVLATTPLAYRKRERE